MARPRKEDTAETNGPQNTEEARIQSQETLRQQEEAKPEPSQEEADAIRERAVTTGVGSDYKNRGFKSE